MLAFPKSPLPCHGPQGGLHSSSCFNFTLGVNNKRSLRPFQRLGFGSQQRMPLSPVRPRQGGLQNSASSVCWAKKKGEKEAEHDPQKATGFSKQASKAEGPSVQQQSKADDDEMEDLEKKTLFLSKWMDDKLYDHMPPACDVAWKETQHAWLDLAINHPITLNNGECTVHLLGIAHSVPTNASALRALVEAVQPDTIAIEQPPSSVKKLRALARELVPQLGKLTALEFPVGIREAHMALSPQDRSRSKEVLEGVLNPSNLPEAGLHTILLMIFGMVPMIEFLAAAHLAPSKKNGISLEGIDLDRRFRARRVLEDPEFDQEYMDQLQQLLGPSAYSFDKLGVNPAFDEWQENAAKMQLLMDTQPFNGDLVPKPSTTQAFLELLGIVSTSPSNEERSERPVILEEAESPMAGKKTFMGGQVPIKGFIGLLGDASTSPSDEERSERILVEVESRMTGKAAVWARSRGDTRNLHMLGRLQQLAVGARPRKCIVAVVGQSHVAPMRELAARNKM